MHSMNQFTFNMLRKRSVFSQELPGKFKTMGSKFYAKIHFHIGTKRNIDSHLHKTINSYTLKYIMQLHSNY